MFALVVVADVLRALVVVVVVCAALIFRVCMALVLQMLCLRPMHVTGLLGGLFMSHLAVAIVPGVWLALAVVCPLVQPTAVIAAVMVTPSAVLMPLVVCQALELIVVTSL